MGVVSAARRIKSLAGDGSLRLRWWWCVDACDTGKANTVIARLSSHSSSSRQQQQQQHHVHVRG